MALDINPPKSSDRRGRVREVRRTAEYAACESDAPQTSPSPSSGLYRRRGREKEKQIDSSSDASSNPTLYTSPYLHSHRSLRPTSSWPKKPLQRHRQTVLTGPFPRPGESHALGRRHHSFTSCFQNAQMLERLSGETEMRHSGTPVLRSAQQQSLSTIDACLGTRCQDTLVGPILASSVFRGGLVW